jgi:monoamine oxidase
MFRRAGEAIACTPFCRFRFHSRPLVLGGFMSVSVIKRLHHKFGPPVDLDQRREFIRRSIAATGAVLLSGSTFVHARQFAAGKRVVVIGAGFAGLSCAYELKSVGYDVTLVEARGRISGRVESRNAALKSEFVPGRNVEAGGELVGANHPCWMHYAAKFGLEFLDLTEEDLEAPIVLDGKRLTEEESEACWEGFGSIEERLNEPSRAVNSERAWESPDAAALDKMSVKDWLDKQVDLDAMTRRGFHSLQSSDNGVDIEGQSLLGLLACIKGHDVERFWTESEVYRCKGGNQLLAEKLADEIGRNRIILGLPVSEVAVKGGGVVVTCRDGRTIECDDVVVTVPPSVWNKIKFSPGIPAALNPQMGVNLKWLAHLKKRVWLDSELSQYALTTGFISQTWDGTNEQQGDENVSFHCFSGGSAANKSLAIPRKEVEAAYLKELETIYPGITENFVKSMYMDWPRDAWAMASYSFPAPGQVTTVGPMLYKGMSPIHFAGEHCSYAFVGYMEGGLHSGTSLARRIAKRDGLNVPEIPMPPTPARFMEEEEPTEPATTAPADMAEPTEPTAVEVPATQPQ